MSTKSKYRVVESNPGSMYPFKIQKKIPVFFFWHKWINLYSTFKTVDLAIKEIERIKRGPSPIKVVHEE
jgi:hypothetical protein